MKKLRLKFAFINNQIIRKMKTREYFLEQTKKLRSELKEEIKSQLYSKLKKGQVFCNTNDDNCIDFEHKREEREVNSSVDYIEIDDNIIIHPKQYRNLQAIDLDYIENIHDLMLLHYISLTDVIK